MRLHPRQVTCFGRPRTRDGVQKGLTTQNRTLFGVHAKGCRVRTDRDHPVIVFAAQPLDGTSNTAPLGTVLLRESGAGRVCLNRKLRLPGMARRREIANKRKIMHLVRQGSRPRSG